jgi:phosphoglycolate phosphatase
VTIRALAVDIDGTVTDYERRIDPKAIVALRKVEQKGIPVILATGNVAPVTKALANFVGLSGPLVCEGGGAIYSNDMHHKKLLFSRKRADQALAKLRKKGWVPRVVWSDPWRESEVALDLRDNDEEMCEILREQGFVVLSTRFALHVMEPGLDKHRGILEALAFLPKKIRPREVLAIGDSHNDVSMLEHAAYSGCVANGTDSAKTVSRYVAKKAHGAGVVEILRHYRVL